MLPAGSGGKLGGFAGGGSPLARKLRAIIGGGSDPCMQILSPNRK
jgi:hypothetical protein